MRGDDAVNRRAFFTSVLIAAGAVLPEREVVTGHPCPVCGLPVVWVGVRKAEDTSPTSRWRTFCALGKIYWHRDGDRLTRCHRDHYALVPVKGVAYRHAGRA